MPPTAKRPDCSFRVHLGEIAGELRVELGFERHRKIPGTHVARTVFVREGEVEWREMGGVGALAELGVVDGRAVSALIEGLLRETKSPEENVHSYRIWDILGLESWTRSHL